MIFLSIYTHSHTHTHTQAVGNPQASQALQAAFQGLGLPAAALEGLGGLIGNLGGASGAGGEGDDEGEEEEAGEENEEEEGLVAQDDEGQRVRESVCV